MIWPQKHEKRFLRKFGVRERFFFCKSPPPGHLFGPYFKVTARTNNGNPGVLFPQRHKPHLENWQTKTPVEVYVFGSSPPCACLFGGYIGGCLQTNQAKASPARFGGAMRRSRATKKNMPCFVRFFTCSQNIKMTQFSLILMVCGHV